tara:strand:- start:1152 stop:1724 length:573 start_codon:yes stop_codon:yes gene_type:complete
VIVFGRDHIPIKGPALLLPKHISNLDTFLIGVMVHNIHYRPLYFMMKASIPSWVEKFGGIRIARPKDLRIRKSKKYSKETNERWKASLQKNMPEYTSWLYQQGEIIVSYPEGERTPGKVGDIYTTSVEHIQQSGISIPIIPIGIEYENKGKFGSKIFIRIGKELPITNKNPAAEIKEIIKNRLKQLSRIE